MTQNMAKPSAGRDKSLLSVVQIHIRSESSITSYCSLLLSPHMWILCYILSDATTGIMVAVAINVTQLDMQQWFNFSKNQCVCAVTANASAWLFSMQPG